MTTAERHRPAGGFRRPAASLGVPRALRPVLRLEPSITDFDVRGFPRSPGGPHPGLRHAADMFVAGYNHAVDADEPDALHQALATVDPDHRGFAYEGAAMALGLLDVLLPGRHRIPSLLAGPGAGYVHLVHVGVGWSYAQLRRPARPGRLTDVPVLGWLAWDGWGFYQGFFRPGDTYRRHRVRRPARTPALRKLHDQGAGRALLFYAGGRPDEIVAVINGFPAGRRADLWAGVGLAVGYTGALGGPDLRRLITLGGGFEADLAQGAAFAGAARLRAGHLPETCARAVHELTGREPNEAAGWTERALTVPHAAATRGGDTAVNYDRWRAGVRACWSAGREGTGR